jgi:hypothetical protein
MERTLRTFDQALLAIDRTSDPPCDQRGRRTS